MFFHALQLIKNQFTAHLEVVTDALWLYFTMTIASNPLYDHCF